MNENDLEPRSESEPPTPPSRRSGRTIAIGIVLLVIVAAGAVVLFLDRGPLSPSATLPSASPSASPLPALLADLPALQKFVAEKRGLAFKQPVKPALLADAAFTARLTDAGEEEIDKKEFEEFEEVLKALKLIKQDVDLLAEADELVADGVVGYYDPKTDELVVRGEKPSPFTRMVLVHELTHALQDQHFNLFRPELDNRDDEVTLGFDAIVEGDALRIERQYFDSLPPEERRQAQLEEETAGGSSDGDVPTSLQKMFAFPYIYGETFVDQLLKTGGQAGLDKSFAEPPATSEYVMHPESFFSKEKVISVPRPPAEGEVFDEGIFGELGLVILLGEGVPGYESATAAQGWGGDYYVAWKAQQGVCIRIDIRMDSSADQAELDDALRAWKKFNQSAELRTGGTSRITACSAG